MAATSGRKPVAQDHPRRQIPRRHRGQRADITQRRLNTSSPKFRYSSLLSERFRCGKLQKARAGQFIGPHAPYGYRYRPRQDGTCGQLAIDDEEAELVRTLYDWLVGESLTLRQILKRLNFGPWVPRCGRRPWSPSTFHHILSDPVYTGTAYSNRYEYLPARKPRSRSRATRSSRTEPRTRLPLSS
ncbi:recombinase family protein (plasmid) [Skermanella mucosa]|uniref:recombinase family protein n=1 Tax=Skermanella mucosa TaxID=1789672 RepID=UPI001E4CDBC5|nr:recombinase family protein [Skermanella mucosa]UEM24417.1 recombinase family protein [Skermanella mucosa]